MKEKEPLVTSDDFGRDEASAKVIYISLVNNPRSTLKKCYLYLCVGKYGESLTEVHP